MARSGAVNFILLAASLVSMGLVRVDELQENTKGGGGGVGASQKGIWKNSQRYLENFL